MWRTCSLIILIFPTATLAQNINKTFLQNPSHLTPGVSGLILEDEMQQTSVQELRSTLSTVKRELEENEEIPSHVEAVKEIHSLGDSATMRFYDVNAQSFELLKESLDLEKSDSPTFDQLMQTIFARIQGQIDLANTAEEISDRKAKYEEIAELYGTLLNQLSLKVSKVNQSATTIWQGNQQLFELSQGLSEAQARATLNALYDGLGSCHSTEDRKSYVEEDKNLYEGMLHKPEYLELVAAQQEMARELKEQNDITENMNQIIDLAKKYDAIEEYEEPIAREVITMVTSVFAVAGGVADKNPFAAVASLGDMVLGFYDTTQGGAPEEHRHNELRERLSVLIEGQQQILRSVQELGLNINEKLKILDKKLDRIQSIVLASQRLIIDLGFKGLRDCEKFTEAKQYYIKTDEDGPRLDWGYKSYESFRSHFAQSELNRYFHSCFDFLNDVVSTKEGLSILSTLQNPSDAELIARQLGQPVDWVEKQMTSYKASLGKTVNFIKRNVHPQFLPAFMGAMTYESRNITTLDHKLAHLDSELSEVWQSNYSKLELEKNLGKLYNPYTVLKMSQYLRELQSFRLYMNEDGDALTEKNELTEPGYYPLDEFNGSSPSQQFDHFSAILRKMDNLLAVTTAQQNLHSGDLLVPFIATVGLSRNFHRWADKHPEKTKLLDLILQAKVLLRDNQLLRDNVVYYKVHKMLRLEPFPDLKEFLENNPQQPGESESDWEARIVAALKQIIYSKHYQYIEVVKNLSKVLSSDHAPLIRAYAEHLEKQLDNASLESAIEYGDSLRKQYIKHTQIDVFENRGNSVVGESFFKKRWAKPMELTLVFTHALDLDYVNFAKDVLFIDLQKKANPAGYDRTLKRDGSRLYLPIATNLAKRFKDQKLVGVHVPSTESLNIGNLATTKFTGELRSERRNILRDYQMYYTYLWQSPASRRVQKYSFGVNVR